MVIYIFCAIDTFSKKAHAAVLLAKTAKKFVLESVKKVLSEVNFGVYILCVGSVSDFKSFLNKNLQNMG